MSEEINQNFYKLSFFEIYDLCMDGYTTSGINMDNGGFSILSFFKDLSLKEIKKHHSFVLTNDEVIINLKQAARERIKYYLEAKKRFLEESAEIIERFRAHSDCERIKKEINKAQMGLPESFLEVIDPEDARTTKSVPRRGFTSRIAKG